MKIVDASIVYKWYVIENKTQEAISLLEDFDAGIEKLTAPDIVLYELANALRYSRKLNPKDVESALENFFVLGIEIITPSIAVIEESIRIAFAYNITVYDAVYIALAKYLGCEFITADKKLSSLSFVKTL